MEVKDILKRERKAHKYTQEQVAKMLNIQRASYAKYETGANMPTVEGLKKLAEIYGKSMDYLAGRYKD